MAVEPRRDWLGHASRLHTCPLCLAAGHYESDYLLALCDRVVGDRGDLVTATALGDLCRDHMGMFAATAREAGVPTEFALFLHRRRLEELAERLSELDPDGWLTAGQCDACFGRNELELLCAHRLLTGLGSEDNATAQQLADAGGLCATHFSMCWEMTSAGADRDALRRIQLAAVQRLADIIRAAPACDELDEHGQQALTERATAITAT